MSLHVYANVVIRIYDSYCIEPLEGGVHGARMVESAPSNSCMVRSVIAHFARWRIIRAKHNVVDSGTKQSTFV